MKFIECIRVTKENKAIIVSIFKLAIPVMITFGMQILLNFVDKFFVSQIGLEPYVGMNLSSSIYNLVIGFAEVITVGNIAIIARRYGENRMSEVAVTTKHSVIFSLLSGIILLFIFYLFSEEILKFFNTVKEVSNHSTIYLKTVSLGFPAIYLGLTIASVFQSTGDTKTPMKIFLLMNIINVILDPILIFGWGAVPAMGLYGAALATLVSNIIGAIIITIALFKLKFIQISNFIKIKFNPGILKKIIQVGSWRIVNILSRPLTAAIMQKVILFHGTVISAGFNIGFQWLLLSFIFLVGLGSAVSILIGQKLGENNEEYVFKVIKLSRNMALIIMTVFIILFYFFADAAISVFNNNPEVIKHGVNYLRIVLIGGYFQVFISIYGAAFNGAGNTKPPAIISLLSNWIGKLLILIIFTYILNLDVVFIWIAIGVSLFLEGILIYTWFKRGTWKEKKV